MFPSNLYEFKIQQKELHKRAARYRLVKSLRKPSRWTDKLYTSVGQTLIMIGQQLLSRTQAAH
jgi:hypothetical protein